MKTLAALRRALPPYQSIGFVVGNGEAELVDCRRSALAPVEDAQRAQPARRPNEYMHNMARVPHRNALKALLRCQPLSLRNASSRQLKGKKRAIKRLKALPQAQPQAKRKNQK